MLVCGGNGEVDANGQLVGQRFNGYCQLAIYNCNNDDGDNFDPKRDCITMEYKYKRKLCSGPIPVVMPLPAHVHMMTDQTREINCVAKGHSEPTVMWKRNGSPIVGDNPHLSVVTRSRRSRVVSTLIIREARRIVSGNYTCEAINCANGGPSGSITPPNSATMQVTYQTWPECSRRKETIRPLWQDETPELHMVRPHGSFVELNCRVDCFPEADIEWWHWNERTNVWDSPVDSNVMMINEVLLIENLNNRTDGSYKCTVTHCSLQAPLTRVFEIEAAGNIPEFRNRCLQITWGPYKEDSGCQSRPQRFWAFDPKYKQCRRQHSSICHDLSFNRFNSEAECEHSCMNYCDDDQVATGHGNARVERFYWDKHARQCRRFFYTMEGGNKNNFLSLRGCQQSCLVRQQLIDNKATSTSQYTTIDQSKICEKDMCQSQNQPNAYCHHDFIIAGRMTSLEGSELVVSVTRVFRTRTEQSKSMEEGQQMRIRLANTAACRCPDVTGWFRQQSSRSVIISGTMVDGVATIIDNSFMNYDVPKITRHFDALSPLVCTLVENWGFSGPSRSDIENLSNKTEIRIGSQAEFLAMQYRATAG